MILNQRKNLIYHSVESNGTIRNDRQRQQGYIVVEGGSLWYEVVGSGETIPLLVLHGGPGLPHDYLKTLEDLSDERSVVFYDQLGCGKSDRPEDATLWRLDRFVAELEELRKQLDLPEVYIFGHSWGAMLATDYVLSRPTGVQGLILASPCISAPQWIRDAAVYRAGLPADVRSVLERHERAGLTNCPEYEAAVLVYYKRHLCRLDSWPEPLERAFAGLGSSVYQTMWGSSEFLVTGSLKDYDRTSRLRELDIPTLFTCGRYDEAAPETIYQCHRLVPRSEMLVFEESAHMPHLEQTQEYLQGVRDFLRPAASPAS